VRELIRPTPLTIWKETIFFRPKKYFLGYTFTANYNTRVMAFQFVMLFPRMFHSCVTELAIIFKKVNKVQLILFIREKFILTHLKDFFEDRIKELCMLIPNMLK
jgi:hypothetical protein